MRQNGVHVRHLSATYPPYSITQNLFFMIIRVFRAFLSATHPPFSLRDPLSVSRKWLAVIVHDSKLGNVCGPFGHFFGHFFGHPL